MQHSEKAPDAKTGRRDVAAGLFLVILAAAIVIAAFSLRIGTPARMGPGFLPFALGVLLAAVGAAIVSTGSRNGESLPQLPRPRALVALVVAFVAFALLIEPAGLVISAFAAVAIAGLALPGRRLIENLLYAAGLSAFAWALFVGVLDMPLKVWP